MPNYNPSGFEFADARTLARWREQEQNNPGLYGKRAGAVETRESVTEADVEANDDDAVARYQSALRLPPMVRLMQDMMRHFERQVPIPTHKEK